MQFICRNKTIKQETSCNISVRKNLRQHESKIARLVRQLPERGADGTARAWVFTCTGQTAADDREAHHFMEQPPERETFALMRGAAGAWVSIGVDKPGKSNGKSLLDNQLPPVGSSA
nr:hypothetical protein Iba_chr08aCG2070 [Ipomoea batatas]GMD26034.1 hypothetical protein Iba_scaffold1176054CG0010 [Ipomoea batatas]